MIKRIVGIALGGLILAACDSNGPTSANGFADTTLLRIVHTVTSVPLIDVVVDGEVVIAALGLGSVSNYVPVEAGTRSIAFQTPGTVVMAPTSAISLGGGDSVTVLTVDSSSVINPWVLTDSGAVVPPGKSKLRVVHFAEQAPALDVWRTQPDFASLITIMFPFPHRAVSPYIQSDPGIWTVLVTTERRDSTGVPTLGDSLLATGDIDVSDGDSRTVLVLDNGAGGLQAQVIRP